MRLILLIKRGMAGSREFFQVPQVELNERIGKQAYTYIFSLKSTHMVVSAFRHSYCSGTERGLGQRPEELDSRHASV